MNFFICVFERTLFHLMCVVLACSRSYARLWGQERKRREVRDFVSSAGLFKLSRKRTARLA